MILPRPDGICLASMRQFAGPETQTAPMLKDGRTRGGMRIDDRRPES
jgi:hypothetical protein